MSCGHNNLDEVTADVAAGPRLATAPTLWRSLEELEGSDQLQTYVQKEFPKAVAEWNDPVSRRNFLRLMGASLALAGVGAATGGCGPNEEKLIPYVVPPEQLIPGKPLQFATTMPMLGYGVGVLAESHMGRPTKLEGNPDHPASLGGSHIYVQASVLSLYDPDRAQIIRRSGENSTWNDLLKAIEGALASAGPGTRLRVLSAPVISPTLSRQVQALLQRYPQAKWYQYEPVSRDAAREGARLAFGRPLNVVYRFATADRVVALDSDFLLTDPDAIRHNREFTDKRRVRGGARGQESATTIHRMYAVEPMPTITGAMADHRIPLRASEVEGFARALLAELTQPGTASGTEAQTITRIAADLNQNRGKSVVVVGPNQPAVVHAIAHAINDRLGAFGQTVILTEPVDLTPAAPSVESLRTLVDEMNTGAVDLLVMFGCNPVFTAPADIDFAAAIAKVNAQNNGVGQTILLSQHYDETAMHCRWHVPETHYLEMWSDIRAVDGTASILQPLIHPLYGGRSAHELVEVLLGNKNPNAREIVKDTWRQASGAGDDFEPWWRTVLEKGIIPNSAAAPVQATLAGGAVPPPTETPAGAGMEVVFRPDPNIYDGRFANNGWLMELPKPLTKLTWDNVAHISPATAVQLGLAPSIPESAKANGKVLSLRVRGATVEAPAWVIPGHADNCVTVHLGFGRTHAGRVGNGAGFNAYKIRFADAMAFARGVEVSNTGDTAKLACTQPHQMIEGRYDLLKVIPVAEMKAGPARENHHGPGGDSTHPTDQGTPGAAAHEHAHAQPKRKHSLTLYPPMPGSEPGTISPWSPESAKQGHAWGMAIDTNVCTGCNACVVACQAENNIPVVGKDQVYAQREMHWLRIDTYYMGEPEKPVGPFFEPMLCQHCENAPCEYVCPVVATSHSTEGINEMTYNRCIGTRYCSNNCPYKVRRFNFLKYADQETPVLQLMYNPDVTVRSRGVMEKCTFCVQRVNSTRRELKILRGKETNARKANENQEAQNFSAKWDELLDSLETACQQACPTRAIVFGDLNKQHSEVKELHGDANAFTVLTELNTEPRVKYLPRLTNHNPEIATLPLKPAAKDAAHH